jgi:hypothetical protein
VIRFVAFVIALVLIGYPPFLIYAITVPVERFRTGSYVDFLAFAGTISAIYGGVMLGVAVHWTRLGRAWQRLRPVGVLKVGAGVTVGVGFGVVLGSWHGPRVVRESRHSLGPALIFALLFGARVGGTPLVPCHSSSRRDSEITRSCDVAALRRLHLTPHSVVRIQAACG